MTRASVGSHPSENPAQNTTKHPDRFAGGNVVWQHRHVQADERAQLLHQKPATLWLTGLSGAGKSTIAFQLEKRLVANGHAAFVLDGDNIRHGLCRDLDFSPESRHENIRRIAEVAKLFNDAGLLVITAFISPFLENRAMAREIIGVERFIEVYLNADISTCEARDAKGLYLKARAGEISEFTGVSSPYEAPEYPALTINTGCTTIEASVNEIMDRLTPYLEK